MQEIRVFNLARDEWLVYQGCTPREAVIAAYAQQTRQDFNTWNYAYRYDHEVRETELHLSIGDFAARK